MKTLLIIQAHPKVAVTLAFMWPWYKGSGLDICGASCDNTPELWPEPVPLINLGHDLGRGGHHLCTNWINTWKLFLGDARFTSYEAACIVEYDCLFTSAFPEFNGGIAATFAGGPYPGLKANQFYHPPWVADREHAAKIIEYGERMINDNDTESGFTDFFVGRMKDLFGLEIQPLSGVYSRNTMDQASDQELARSLIKEGRLFMVHGVKTKEQLMAILP